MMTLILASLLLLSGVVLAAALATDANPRLTDLLQEQTNRNDRDLFSLPDPIDFYSSQCEARCDGVGGSGLEPFLNACPKCPEKYAAAHCNNCCLDGASSLRIRWHGCPGVVRFAPSDSYFEDCEEDPASFPLASSSENLRFVDCDCYNAITHPGTTLPADCPLLSQAQYTPDDADVCSFDLCIVSVDLDFSRPLPDVVGLVHESYSTTQFFTTYIDTTCCLQDGGTSPYTLPIYPGYGKFPNTCVEEGFIDLELVGQPTLPDSDIDHFDGYPPVESFWYEFIDGTSSGFWPLDEMDGALTFFDPTFAACTCKTCDGPLPFPIPTTSTPEAAPVAGPPSLASHAPSSPHATTPTTPQPIGGITLVPVTPSPSLPGNRGPSSPEAFATPGPHVGAPSFPQHPGPDTDTVTPSQSPTGRTFSPRTPTGDPTLDFQTTPSLVPTRSQTLSPITESPLFPSLPGPNFDTTGPSTFRGPDIQTQSPTAVGTTGTESPSFPSHPGPDFDTHSPSVSLSQAPVAPVTTRIPTSYSPNFTTTPPTLFPTVPQASTPTTQSPSFPSQPRPSFHSSTPSTTSTRNPISDSPHSQTTQPTLVPSSSHVLTPTTVGPSFPSRPGPDFDTLAPSTPLQVTLLPSADHSFPSMSPTDPNKPDTVPSSSPVFAHFGTVAPTRSTPNATNQPSSSLEVPSPMQPPRATDFPTLAPTWTPSVVRTESPFSKPPPTRSTNNPTLPLDTQSPTLSPTNETTPPSPTLMTITPTGAPTPAPTAVPANIPTPFPTPGPIGASDAPSARPPTAEPTEAPSVLATSVPTDRVDVPSEGPAPVPVQCQLSDFRLCAAFSLSRCLTSGAGGLPAAQQCLYNGNTERRRLFEPMDKELEYVIAAIKESPIGRNKLKDSKEQLFGLGGVRVGVANRDPFVLGVLIDLVEELKTLAPDSRALADLRFGLSLLSTRL